MVAVHPDAWIMRMVSVEAFPEPVPPPGASRRTLDLRDGPVVSPHLRSRRPEVFSDSEDDDGQHFAAGTRALQEKSRKKVNSRFRVGGTRDSRVQLVAQKPGRSDPNR